MEKIRRFSLLYKCVIVKPEKFQNVKNHEHMLDKYDVNCAHISKFLKNVVF